MLVFVIVTEKEPSVEYYAGRRGEGINNEIMLAYTHTHTHTHTYVRT
jgi:hypothetical protein